MMIYIENPKESTVKLLETINQYSKVAGYKVNTQKTVAFLYTNNEVEEFYCGLFRVFNVYHHIICE